MDMTLAELQEMAARQQQQIEAQQQLLASKVCKGVQNERGEKVWCRDVVKMKVKANKGCLGINKTNISPPLFFFNEKI